MLQVENINVYHGNLQALWGVSLRVDHGELISLIGANGAGKSTIVETIAGLMTPGEGNISFEGICINNTPPHKIVELGVSLILENRGLFPKMSVVENLEMGAFPPAARSKRASAFKFVYDLFPILEERNTQLAGTLSGGEQQMLAIGRALMSQPKLLICDEPSLGLAPIMVNKIFAAIQEINNSGVGVLLVEQNVKVALSLSKRAYIIENGRVTGQGESNNLLGDKKVMDAYLGTG